ncbi:MAG: AMP-binding protein [Deltaproteobacteria bacterium]|nr:AMP-binding protein [Deltaproteobacteria bacterium]
MKEIILRCEAPLGPVTPNIGTLFLRNASQFGSQPAFAERSEGKYRYWSWEILTQDILRASTFFRNKGLVAGDRVALVATNSHAKLVAEMAVMSSGLVSVPIFIGYPKALVAQLIAFSKVRFLMIENFELLRGLPVEMLPKTIVLLKGQKEKLPGFKGELLCFDEILGNGSPEEVEKTKTIFKAVPENTLSLIMFTSGTSGFPKGVQLTHRNLMSQQRALEILWKPEPGMRFLCYLPWHHSFGGLFERFFALHSGGCLAIDDSCGKNVDRLLENFAEIKPHLFFSVPKIYQEIVSRVLKSHEIEQIFFHKDLKYVFTAAAPLPLGTSEVFKKKNIPVVEGWGLTETSPCCTLTERSLEREPGVVGFPIPGVEIRLGDENEICVRGPNVMLGYVDQPEATANVLTSDGWFSTGDIGELTTTGVRILSRKDRMFKLNNGEKIFPAVIEERIKSRCDYVKHAYVFGRGQVHPCVALFPNQELFSAKKEGDECKNPTDCEQLAQCLKECLEKLNEKVAARFERVSIAAVIRHEPTLEKGELTPSFKLVPSRIQENFETYLIAIEKGLREKLPEDAWLVSLEAKDSKRKSK